LKVQSNRFANVLKGLGVGKGTWAFVMLPRIPQWYVVMLGLIKVGAVPIPATNLCTPGDIEYRVNEAEAALAITDMENSDKVAETAGNCPTLEHLLLVVDERRGWVSYDEEMSQASAALDNVEPTRSDDPLLIFFTSDTVGYPKMVLHTKASYGLAHVITAKYWHDLKATDLQWTLLDTGWAKTAYGKLFGQWTQGASVLQHDARGRFDPVLTTKIMERYGVTSLCAPPTAYRMMVLEDLTKYDLGELRHCTGAGEPLNPEVMKI
jgi:acetyl-CoA synthetase